MHSFQIFFTKIFFTDFNETRKEQKSILYLFKKKLFTSSTWRDDRAKRSFWSRSELEADEKRSFARRFSFFFLFFFLFFFIFFFFFFFSKKNSSSNFEFDSRSRFSREESFAQFFFFVEERESIVMRTRERFRSFLITSKTSSSMFRSTTRSNKRVYKR